MAEQYNKVEKAKTEKPEKVKPDKLEKITHGEVISKPKGIGTRVKAVFFGGEFRDAASYVASEVVLPAFRRAIVDAVVSGTERVIWGDRPRARSRGFQDYQSRQTYNYNQPVNRGPLQEPRERAYLPDQPGRMQRRLKETNDIIMANRQDAEAVLEKLMTVIAQYDVVSLADLYETVGLPSSHIDNKWGWTFLSDVEIRQVREGWLIDLPPAESI